MTGTVILQLIDEGKLSFDDVIDTYVPGMPNGDKATIKNLIEMQSGIPTYTADTSVLNTYSKDPTTAFTPQDLVNSVKKLPPMFAPGEQFFYSNTNFVLLGMVIEKVTGESIADNFGERLFTPLGMKNTSIPGTSTDIPAPFLSGISQQTDPLGTTKDATNWNPSFASTAGEAISTLDDLHKWGVALGTGEGILPPETQQMRVESVNTTVPPNTPQRSYGMGIVNTGGWLGHTGEIPGYNTVVNYQPDLGITIAVMVNSDITKGPAKQQIAPAPTAFQGLAQVVAPSPSPSPSAS
jgi:D-alanyl-D-alanine carboxypeptidase